LDGLRSSGGGRWVRRTRKKDDGEDTIRFEGLARAARGSARLGRRRFLRRAAGCSVAHRANGFREALATFEGLIVDLDLRRWPGLEEFLAIEHALHLMAVGELERAEERLDNGPKASLLGPIFAATYGELRLMQPSRQKDLLGEQVAVRIDVGGGVALGIRHRGQMVLDVVGVG